MFQFAAFALPVLCIQTGVTIRWGCPIRRSEDHSLVTGSSRLIAGSRVLHRLSMPRHPSCALSVLAMPTWPPLGTGACQAGLCGSGLRLASHCSRAPATQYSRSFSVQFNLRSRSLHYPEIQGLLACPVRYDQHFTCQRSRTAKSDPGRTWYPNPRCRQGVRAVRRAEFWLEISDSSCQ